MEFMTFTVAFTVVSAIALALVVASVERLKENI